MSSQEPPKKKSKQVENKQGTLLKRVKTYLRSTTGDSRLNHLMMLHVHKDRTDALTLVDVANNFVGEKENRKQLFGRFSANDIPNKFPICQSQHKRKEELCGRSEWRSRGADRVDLVSSLFSAQTTENRNYNWACSMGSPVIRKDSHCIFFSFILPHPQWWESQVYSKWRVRYIR